MKESREQAQASHSCLLLAYFLVLLWSMATVFLKGDIQAWF